MRLTISLFLASIHMLAVHFAYAEVEKVTIKWKNPGICLSTCAHSLEQQFDKVNGVATVSINEGAGQAELTWKPNVPFTYHSLDAAMRLVGVSIHDFRVRVRGTITHDDRSLSLLSIGDNTRFVLLGPITPSVTNMVIEHNIENHPISPGKRDQLLNAQASNQIVIVEGPIFEGWRSPPLYLIAEQITVTNPSSQGR